MSKRIGLASIPLAILLAALTVLLWQIPALVYVGPIAAVGFALLLFLWALLFAATQPARWFLWGCVFGLAPFTYAVGVMGVDGPGNLWPIDLLLALALGLLPASLGVLIGTVVARSHRERGRAV